MPAQPASMVTLRNKVASHTFLKIIKTDVDNFEVICDICVKSFTIRKTNHISDHIKGAGLSKATRLKTHQGPIVTNKKGHSEDFLSLSFLTQKIKVCQETGYSATRAVKQLEEIFGLLVDLE